MEGITRLGERSASGAASFRCAQCGELAGVVRVSRAGAAASPGPPLGQVAAGRDGLVVDYFLGTAWQAAAPETVAAVLALLEEGSADPLALRAISALLVPFYCPDCQLNYCASDWSTEVLFDEGFYDCTMGTCPNGHRHMVDD